MRRLAVLTLLAITSTAAADPGPPGMTPANANADLEPPPAAPLVGSESGKSEGVAQGLALGTTFGGVLLFAVGVSTHSEAVTTLGGAAVFVGPSAGHIYAGQNMHAVGMSLLRGAGAVAFVYGIVQQSTVEDGSGPSERDRENGKIAMFIGAGTWVGATIYDIIDSRGAARRYNSEHAISVAPLVAPQAAGVSIAGRF